MKQLSILLTTLCLFIQFAHAQVDTIPEPDRMAEDFVEVYLVVAEPTSTAYSTLGHACLRLQCDTYGLDYMFTYESEDATKKILSFLSGNLKMGMFNIEPEEYIDYYRDEHRGVLQYKLNLPAEAKTRLWELLDREVMKGPCLPYDLKRSCAQTILQFITKSLHRTKINYAPWPEKYNMTRREIVSSNLKNYQWTDFLFSLLIGNDADMEVSKEEKVVVPTDLVKIFQTADINGTKIITDKPIILVESKPIIKSKEWFSPMLVACLLFLIVLSSIWLPSKKSKVIDIILLSIVTILGLVIFYVMFIGHLPHAFWNWLFIPLNPFIALFWRWRNYWIIPYVAMLLIWISVMLIYPHTLVNNSFIILIFGEMIVMFKSADFRIISAKK